MKKRIVMLNYPESQWGTDLVCFAVPDSCTDDQIIEELRWQRSTLHSDDFDSVEGMSDTLCQKTAEALGGTWEYVAQSGSFDVTAEDDETCEEEE